MLTQSIYKNAFGRTKQVNIHHKILTGGKCRKNHFLDWGKGAGGTNDQGVGEGGKWVSTMDTSNLSGQ